MGPQRLVRAGTPAEVSVLAVMALTVSAGCLGLAAFPMAQDAPRGLMIGFGLVGATVAVALVLAGPRVSPVQLHVAVVLYAALIAVLVAVAVTERGLMMGALARGSAAVFSRTSKGRRTRKPPNSRQPDAGAGVPLRR